MAVAVPAAAYAAAQLAAQMGLGTAASYAIDKGIKKGIPKLLGVGKKITKNSKYKTVRKISRGLGKVEKAYNSKYGKYGQEAASLVGGLLAFHGAGKAVQGAKNLAQAVNVARGAKSAGVLGAMQNLGGTQNIANHLTSAGFRVPYEARVRVPTAEFNRGVNIARRVGKRFPASAKASTKRTAEDLFKRGPSTQEVISKMRPETQAKYHKLRAEAQLRNPPRAPRAPLPSMSSFKPSSSAMKGKHPAHLLPNQFNS